MLPTAKNNSKIHAIIMELVVNHWFGLKTGYTNLQCVCGQNFKFVCCKKLTLQNGGMHVYLAFNAIHLSSYSFFQTHQKLWCSDDASDDNQLLFLKIV